MYVCVCLNKCLCVFVMKGVYMCLYVQSYYIYVYFRFEQILMLPGHTSGIWGLDISTDSDTIVTVSQDKSIRLWNRSTDLVFIEEEKERALEAMVVNSAITGGGGDVIIIRIVL